MAISPLTRLRWAAALLAGRDVQLVPEPWDFVQRLVEQRLHEYLDRQAQDVRLVVIVGAWRGHEVGRMLERYSAARFVCLEPHPSEFSRLSECFAAEPRVSCVAAAAADVSADGVVLHATDVDGTSSLLPPHDPQGRFREQQQLAVRAVRLDDLDDLDEGERVDCLWIDVQGAESAVLRGAEATLARTGAVFAEVSTRRSAYAAGATFAEVDELLGASGFSLAALGTDPANGEGNALWLRRRVA